MDYGNKNGFGPKFDSNLSDKEKNAHLFSESTEQRQEGKEETVNATAEKRKAASISDSSSKPPHVKSETREKREKKEKRRHTGYIVLKVIMFVIFGALLILYGVGRAENANKLIGSTQLPTQEQQSGTITDINLGGDTSTEDIGYSYIDAGKLDKMSATDLAKWYVKQFSGENINQVVLAEFNNWYAVKIAQNNSFDAEYKAALEAAKANSDDLTPTPEKPSATEPTTKPEDEKTDGDTSTVTPDGAQTTEPDASEETTETPAGAEEKAEDKTQDDAAKSDTATQKG